MKSKYHVSVCLPSLLIDVCAARNGNLQHQWLCPHTFYQVVKLIITLSTKLLSFCRVESDVWRCRNLITEVILNKKILESAEKKDPAHGAVGMHLRGNTEFSFNAETL